MKRPIITFLTDLGRSAPAVCRGVMLGIDRAPPSPTRSADLR